MSHDLSHFAEKSGIVAWQTPWGSWWQTVHEVHIEVNLPEHVKARDVTINIKANTIECLLCDEVLFEGRLPGPVHPDETVWTVEDEWQLVIVLAKGDYSLHDDMWSTLLVGEDLVQPDPGTLHDMRKKLDLERFQLENPGMDFSNAKLSKNYDRLPGWSTSELAQRKELE